MGDPQTYWITVTNIALGVAALVGILAAAGGIAHEFICRRRTRKAVFAEMDDDLRRLLGSDAYDWQIHSN